ncbi:MAG: thioredoxin-disulfide reductase [Candidatus Heimdallarchaeota archaeon]|nr:thioredoxin-disulfide reductase [Candidatus Heimdallarchaeota archaeon]
MAKKGQIAIIGAGPAGLTAAIYTARAGLATVVLGNPYDSQVAKLGVIENYPGFAEGIQGLELIEAMENQAKANNVEVIYEQVISIESIDDGFSLKTEEDETIEAKSIILAMGSRYRKIRIPGEEEFYAKGVSYCAVCDGALYQGKNTVVVGYGTGAAKAAVYLSNISPKVYLICPKKELGAEAIYEDRLNEKDNIEVHYLARVKEILGEEFVEKVHFKEKGEIKEIKTEGVFIEYGTVPNTVLAEQIGVQVDEKGFIMTNSETLETNVPGVFAAGDVRGQIRQIATAVGDGCITSYGVQKYLGE